MDLTDIENHLGSSKAKIETFSQPGRFFSSVMPVGRLIIVGQSTQRFVKNEQWMTGNQNDITKLIFHFDIKFLQYLRSKKYFIFNRGQNSIFEVN